MDERMEEAWTQKTDGNDRWLNCPENTKKKRVDVDYYKTITAFGLNAGFCKL